MTVLDTRWYRLLGFYSSLIIATASWAVACLPVATVPAATAALLRDVTTLTRGASGLRSRREWFRDVLCVARRTVWTGAVIAAGAAGSAIVAATTPSPVIAGSALAVFCLGLCGLGAAGFAIAADCIRPRDILRAIVVRPLTIAGMGAPWAVAAAVLLVTPPMIAIPVWACSAGGAAVGSVAVARLASRVLRSRKAAPVLIALLSIPFAPSAPTRTDRSK